MKGAQQTVDKSSTAVTTKRQKRVELPDFYSHDETAQFVNYLKENIDRYGVKTLLYESEKILTHLEWIDKHVQNAQKILLRVNGSITTAQRQAYKARAAETAAKKFYGSMSDTMLDVEMHKAGYIYNSYIEPSREVKIQRLVEEYVKRRVKVESEKG